MTKVNISFLEDEPIILAAVAAKISQTSFEKGSIEDLYKECRADKEGSVRLVNMIMRKYDHMIFGDFLPYAITLENLSRFGAIYLWQNVNIHNLIFGAGIEASFRVIKPNRYKETVDEFGKIAFEIYERAINLEVPRQDARYVLPEGTLTRMIFTAPPRYLVKLASALENTPLQELRDIGERIKMLIREKFGFEIPQESLVSKWKFWGKEEIREGVFLNSEGKTCSLSLNMGIRGSLSMYAQLVRQRQFLCDIEPLEEIARKRKFVVPSSFPESIKRNYREIANKALKKQIELIENKDPNFVYFLLLGQEATSMIYGKGLGIIETSKARSEGVAQWEIRNRVGIPLTERLAEFPEFQQKIGPRCWREGKCIEPSTFKTKKNVCKAFAKSGGNWKGSLKELLEVLKEPYQTFSI